MNLGGVLFGTGLNSDIVNPPISGETGNGKIGIRKSDPQTSLDVSGQTTSHSFIEHLVNAGNVSTNYTIDLTKGSAFDITLTGNTDFSIQGFGDQQYTTTTLTLVINGNYSFSFSNIGTISKMSSSVTYNGNVDNYIFMELFRVTGSIYGVYTINQII